MLSKAIKNEKIWLDIQEKKEKVIDLDYLGSVNIVFIKLNYIFVTMKKELIMLNPNNDLSIIKKIKLDDDYKIYKVFKYFNFIYLVNEKFIIRYDCNKDFKKLDEFKWNEEMTIKKLKHYRNFLIWRYHEFIIIINLPKFKIELELKVKYSEKNKSIYKYYSYYSITVYDNYLLYIEKDNIIILNLNLRFQKIKEFFYSKLNYEYIYIYKNYFIYKKSKKLNIIDLKNDKEMIVEVNIDYDEDLEFSKQNNLLSIKDFNNLYIYDMDNLKLIIKMKHVIYFNKFLTFFRNILISPTGSNSYSIFDYKNKNLIYDFKIANKWFFKIKDHNLICTDKNKIKMVNLKNDLNIFSMENYNYYYKNYGIYICFECIKIYDTEKYNELIYEWKINLNFVNHNWIYNYLVIINNKKTLIILNLDNFEDIKEKNYEFSYKELCIYRDNLYISFENYIEIVNINNLTFKEISENNFKNIYIYEHYLFVFYIELLKIYDIKNDIKFIKKVDILMKSFKVKKHILAIYEDNLDKIFCIIDINNNFQKINIDKKDNKLSLHLFNDIIILYGENTLNIYKKNKKKYERFEFNYIGIHTITSLDQYLFIEQENNTKVVIYKNNKFKTLKLLKISLKRKNRIYIFDGFLYWTSDFIIKIFNIKNNFEDIKVITNEKKFVCNMIYNKDYLLIKYDINTNGKLLFNFENYKINWDIISYNYFLKIENLKNELNINFKTLYEYYENNHILENSVLFNYILKINYNVIKYTENYKLLTHTLNIFGIDKFFIQLKNKFNWIDLIISYNKINIFLEPLLDYYINNNHFYEINYSQFLKILEKIKDIYLFKIFIKYIFQKYKLPEEYEKIKYINLNEYKIVNSKYLYYNETLNNKIFNNNSSKYNKIEFEIFNIPFKICQNISENHKFFGILEKCPDFIKESNLKYLVYHLFDKIKYFKYFNIIMYLLLIICMTISLVNKDLVFLIIYLLCIIYFIFYEIMQFYYDYKSYFKLWINWFDIFLIIYNIIIFVYIYLGLFNSINLIIMPLYYLNGYKLINFLKSIDLIRKEIRLFINVIKNTTSFIFFIVIILIYFTNLNFLFNFNNFNKYNLSFFNVYSQMLGNFDDNFSEYRFYDYLELLVNTYSFNIILLNWFISVISKIFDNYNDNLELYDIQEKINLLQEFSSVYFIIDYINKIIFKYNNKKKYYFFVFEKKRIEINLVDLESNIKTKINSKIDEVKEEIKDIKTGIKSEIKEIKGYIESEVYGVKNELRNIKSDLYDLKKNINSFLMDFKNNK